MNDFFQHKSNSFKTKAEIAYEHIYDAIICGRFKPGQPLVASEIAENLGLSRMPVREAIKKLEVEGLVDVNPHCGTSVSIISVQDVEEYFFLRVLLEGTAAHIACSNITNEGIKELKRIIEDMEEMVEKGEYVSYGKLNRDFHIFLYSFSKNYRLYMLIQNLFKSSERLRGIFIMAPERSRKSLKEHKEIIKALEKKDKDTVKKLVENHAKNAQKELIEKLKADS